MSPRRAHAPHASLRRSAPDELSVTQIEANVAHELSNLLNVVSACGERLASSPDVTAAARLDLLALAGRVAHAIIDGRRRGVSLRRWISVNPTLRHLEAAVRLLLSSAIDVALELDPSGGHRAPRSGRARPHDPESRARRALAARRGRAGSRSAAPHGGLVRRGGRDHASRISRATGVAARPPPKARSSGSRPSA